MFGTSGIRGRVGETVTADLALAVGRALGATGHERVVLGRDPRESGTLLSDALAAGVRETGGDVVRLGQAATPTIARAVGWLAADAGVVVTASHNPAPDNGLKLWTATGRAFDESQQAEIESWVNRLRGDQDSGGERKSDVLVGHDAIGVETHRPGMTARHESALVDAIRRDLDAGPTDAGTHVETDDHHAETDDHHAESGGPLTETEDPLVDLSIVVDVGNGAGGVTASALAELGADVRALNAQPDGEFPGRPSEPTAENCRALSSFVATTDADLGVAHDGDADRMMAVTADGEFLRGDVLLAIFATDAVRRAETGHRVAAPLNTSLAVDDALSTVDGELVHTKVGDGYVAERTETDDVVFGGEMSGAWIWPEETLCPDGPLAACRLAALVARRGAVAELAAAVPTYPTRRESVEVADKQAVMDAVTDRVHEDYSPDAVEDSDGVRVDTDDGWFLVRASGTQPLVRLTAEARAEDRSDALATRARTYLERAIDAHETSPSSDRRTG